MNQRAPGLGTSLGADARLPREPAAAGIVPARRLPLIGPGGERVEPAVHGEKLLGAGSRVFTAIDALVARWIRPELNPFVHSGAIANTCFIVACVSGVVLLIWYSTSVHHAYDSVAAMAGSPIAELTRSLHRYSSDAALLFALLHAVRLVFARRFGGARWLAWVTGLTVVSLLWLVGWLGYWLVWDQRGQSVALATAHLLDVLPLFSDPLSRSFVADATLSSLLFFVVFFLHMLLPLAMAVGLWLHITRLSRPVFLTNRWLTAWVMGCLMLVSLLAPADLAERARMATRPLGFTIDAWFLLPVVLADRMQAGVAWALTLFGGVLLLSLPWSVARKRARPASVTPARCTACAKCYHDCPYDAIRMQPRSDGRAYPAVAVIDMAKCVGCGVCAGSCDSAGIGLPWFDAIEQRQELDRLLETATASGDARALVLGCAHSAAAELTIDAETATSASLPGSRVVRVPCAGWIHPLLVERALRRGAASVAIIACGPGSCNYREGAEWTLARMAAEREPKLRLERVGTRVRVLSLFRHQQRELMLALSTPQEGVSPRPAARARGGWLLAALVLAGSFTGVAWAGTRVPYRAPGQAQPELVVSLKAPGQAGTACRPLTEAEQRSRPIHMQRTQICDRGRADVRLRVSVDGREVLKKSFPPRGVWGDGHSVALEHLPVPSGTHLVRVEIGTAPGASFPHVAERQLQFSSDRRAVVLFDQSLRFSWH